MSVFIKYLCGLIILSLATLGHSAQTICAVNNGLQLINQEDTHLSEVKKILQICDKQTPNEVRVLLLHGLLARKESVASRNYATAINWLQKANIRAAYSNIVPMLELAVTYEWAGEYSKANVFYNLILSRHPDSRPALLGSARAAVGLKNFVTANKIYNMFLMKNPRDIDALNGLARLHLTQNKLDTAKKEFEKLLTIDVNNADAITGLKQVNALLEESDPDNFTSSMMICVVNYGLRLFNLPNPPINKIEKILARCDKQMPDDEKVLMLHGMLARKKGVMQQSYNEAIDWFKKAVAVAPTNDFASSLELAVTYEWANDAANAKLIYTNILAKQPTLRAAILGLARTAVLQHDFNQATSIYQTLLKDDSKDTDALNGLARMNLSDKKYSLAKTYFQRVLVINPENSDALLGIKQIEAAMQQQISTTKNKKIAPALCQANQGLDLLNQLQPDYRKINQILVRCDHKTPNDVQTLLLHGLLARKEKKYSLAVEWLQKAVAIAAPNNSSPALELAVTYEWLEQPDKAKKIYTEILKKNSNARPALLGNARVERAQYHLQPATIIYQNLLKKNPHDTDALNGLAWVKLTDKKFTLAHHNFEKTLLLKPNDAEAKLGLQQLDKATRYLLTVNGGKYTVGKSSSLTGNVNFYADLNATDQFILQMAHNTNELQLGLVIDPTILPKNDVLIGFQRQIPNRYGWGINYEYRVRTHFRPENRIGANANVYLLNNLQWLVGARYGYPSPWSNKLYYSGLTLLTRLPVNFSLTAFYGMQETGGNTSAFAFDMTKEFSTRLFYDVGTSYSPTQISWEVHSRLILPAGKNQAIECQYQHNYFNNTNIYSLGWRFYW